MKRILIAVLVVAVVAAIAVSTRNRLPRVEEAEATPPGAVVAPPSVSPEDSVRAPAPLPDASPIDSSTAMDSVSDHSAADAAPATDAPAEQSASTRPVRDVVTGAPAQSTQRPAAGAILERAAASYEDVRSMQADFAMTMTNPLLRRTTNSQGTLYQRRPDRIALRFSEPAGDVIVSDGEYFWIYYPSVNAQQVIRMPASQGASGGVDLQAQFVGDPTARFDATLHGTERVGQRETHVLTLKPRAPAAYRELKVWLDTRDYLARRFEIVEENGSIRRFDLSNLRTNLTLPDATFRFTPPAGAQIVDRG